MPNRIVPCAVLLLASCGGVAEYMPLEVGNWWEYTVETVEYLGPLPVDSSSGLRYSEVTFHQETSSRGRMYWITRLMEDQGIAYGYYMCLEDGALMVFSDTGSTSGEVYLQGPLDAGTTWETVSWGDVGASVSSEIIDTGMTLEVPAGTYEDCLGVRMTSEREVIEQYSGPEEITWEIYYAPGTGVVRSVLLTVNPASTLSRRSVLELNDLYVR